MGQIGNNIAFNTSRLEDVSDEVLEIVRKPEGHAVTSLADLMSLEDAERYLNFLKNGSTAGLTGEES